MTLTAIDLFCGAGGFSTGLERAGFQVVGALDSWRPAVDTYRANFDHPIVQADIRTLSTEKFLCEVGFAGEVDLIVGGPPCQGFSVQRIGLDTDHRNDLIFEFARFVAEIRPRMFLMENVPGLLGKRGHHLAIEFEQMVRQEGYSVRVQTVDAVDFGIPQFRRRVFFFGWIRDRVLPFAFSPLPPIGGRPVTVWDAIGDLGPPAEKRTDARDPLHWRTGLSPINVERLSHIPPGGGFENLPVELRVTAHKAGAARIGHRNVYGRLDPNKPAGTITAGFDSFTRGKFAHPYENRNISLREGARLQGFGDEHRFCGTQEDIAALIGNAVSPRLSEAIAKDLAAHLSSVTRDNSRSISVGSSAPQIEFDLAHELRG